MKLTRLELTEFKRFRDTLVLQDLVPGLNIIVGANEAGKSTIATALRAAFLERFKTTKVAEFAPEGLAQARPSVAVDFEVQGMQYRLNKSFLSRARCELIIGDRRLEGEQAEDALAVLLGFDFPQKGQSRPIHAGIPGLLWITQGTSQLMAEPASHAGVHLRDALTRLSGEMAATDGDRLFQRVELERAALIDARNGKPKGRYREAQEAVDQASDALAQIQLQKATWETDVDRLAALRLEHERALQTPAWIDLEQRAADAREKLAAMEQEKASVERARVAWRQAQGTVALLAEHVARDDADLAEVTVLEEKCEHAEEVLTAAGVRKTQAGEAMVLAQTQYESLARLLDVARRADERRSLQVRCETSRREHAVLETALAQALASDAEVKRQRARAADSAVSQDDLKRLRDGALIEMRLRARADAVATRLVYTLAPQKSLSIDGQTVSGEGATLIFSATDIDLPGLGRMTVSPGGDDLEKVRRDLDTTARSNAALCLRLGVTGLDQAEARAVQAQNAERDLEFALKALHLHAPQGVQSVRDALEVASASLAGLDAQLASLPEQDALDGDLHDVQARHDSAQSALTRARDSWRDAGAAADTAQAQYQWVHDQHRVRQESSRTQAAEDERRARRERLREERRAVDDLDVRARQAHEALQAQQPDLIEQDAQRFERSARVARESHQGRQSQMQQLQGKLEQAGAQGMGEALARAQADLERLTRRRDDIALRAQALSLLYERLGQQRDAATKRLFAPLAQRLNHYLGLLFPSADIRLGDDFSPTILSRAGAHDPLESLSFGTQEQLGVLTRLAYADVLQAAGRPTLLVLDDALVHTDDARREQMKRALFDAATRHQILMLTCHGEAWRDMGVALRKI